ncbi:uncharacterized protein LOC117648184 [Thrips palmi]|uniref:Gustatory receptor n=1 Tax=Thrips palmi TaxID=161013 RepID=A0A6P8ZCJ4_THRPL|nr:uncharacterized protein LOC117648184 [Thrips palmi]
MGRAQRATIGMEKDFRKKGAWMSPPSDPLAYPARIPVIETTSAFASRNKDKSSCSPERSGNKDKSPSSPDRDMFGGHGMFAPLWPIGCAMAAVGLLPVTCSPIRISFHPLRSTLVYCLAVAVLALWSGYIMLQDRYAMLVSPGASLKARFNSVICITHAAGFVLQPLLWIEASHMKYNEALCTSLMETVPGAARSRNRWFAALVWTAAISLIAAAPFLATVYVRVIAEEGGFYSHIFMHCQVVLLNFYICLMFSTHPHCVKDFANGLRQYLIQELSLQHPSPRKLLKYRRAWLQLRDLTQGLVTMPLTGLYVLLFNLLLTTLGAYLCLVCFFERQVGENFLRPLEGFSGSALIGEAAMEEINIFREIVASNEITVSVAGFWVINRGTVSSIAAAAVSYLVILIQFRQTEGPSEDLANRSIGTTTTKTMSIN